MPIVRMEQNLDVLVDGLEGQSFLFSQVDFTLTLRFLSSCEAKRYPRLGIQYSIFPVSPDCRNRSERGNMRMAAENTRVPWVADVERLEYFLVARGS